MSMNNYNEKCLNAPCEKPKSPSTPTEVAISHTNELIAMCSRTLYGIEDMLLKLGYFAVNESEISPDKSPNPTRLYEIINNQNEKLYDLNYRLKQCLNLLVDYV